MSYQDYDSFDYYGYIGKIRATFLRSEIEKLEGMERSPFGEGVSVTPYEVRGYNDALTSIITRYKEELLELDGKEYGN